MTIGEAKIKVCDMAVDAVKNVMRDFGAVCENCASYKKFANISEKFNSHSGICRPDCHQVHADGFCESFRFRSVEECEPLYKMILESYKNEEVSTE